MRACSEEMGSSYSDHNLRSSLSPDATSMPPLAGSIETSESAVSRRMIDLINHRLVPCTNVLMEQATAVHDLTAQIGTIHSAASSESLTARLLATDLKDPSKDVLSTAGAAHSALSDAAVRCRRAGGDGGMEVRDALAHGRLGGSVKVSVSAVPIVGGGADGSDTLDVTRLLHKVYQYRTDAEIEEGLCARLSTVEARSVVAQVERMLPALTNIILYSQDEMVYLTREIVRLCMCSLHFASRFLWCLRTAWPREAGFVDRLQLAMHTSHFQSAFEGRLGKLLWLATYAITLKGRSDVHL